LFKFLTHGKNNCSNYLCLNIFFSVMGILKKENSKTCTGKYIAGLKCEFRLFSCSSGNLVIPPLRRNAMLGIQCPGGFKLTSCKKSQNIRKKVIEPFLDPVINSVEPIYGKLGCGETLLVEKCMKALHASCFNAN